MAFVISKIIGDGQSTETAFRTVVQEFGVRILPGTFIPVDPKTGIPTSDFALIEIPDEDVPIIENLECFVVPKGGLDKAQLSKALSDQGCAIEIADVHTPDDLVAVVAAKVQAEYAVKK